VATWPRRTSYFATAPWRGTWRGEGGGILINQGQHNLDTLCFVADQPSAVTAITRNAIHPTETEDTAHAMLRWANGAVGGVHLSSAEVDVPMRIEVTGTAGRLRVLPGRLEAYRNDMDSATTPDRRGTRTRLRRPARCPRSRAPVAGTRRFTRTSAMPSRPAPIWSPPAPARPERWSCPRRS
jgi:predicted dehydrogenase